MRPTLHSASGRDWPAYKSTAVLAALTALPGMFAGPAPAMAQTPPTFDPSVQYGLALIGAPVAWEAGYTDLGITVAVGDTGIDTTHPAFAGKIDPRSMNFVLPSPGAPYVPAQITDLYIHGTHVSGIIAASGSSQAPGVAYDANIAMFRVLADTPSCQDADCSAPGIPNATASSLDYFAGLQDVRIYNATYPAC